MLALAEPDAEVDQPLTSRCESCSAASATVVVLPEGYSTRAGACSGVGPAYWALVAEAWVEAGDPPRASRPRSPRGS